MMQDEIWMRNWNDAHPRFSADVDQGLARIAKAISAWRRRGNNGAALRRRIGLG